MINKFIMIFTTCLLTVGCQLITHDSQTAIVKAAYSNIALSGFRSNEVGTISYFLRLC